jgi:hypothetical protein
MSHWHATLGSHKSLREQGSRHQKPISRNPGQPLETPLAIHTHAEVKANGISSAVFRKIHSSYPNQTFEIYLGERSYRGTS